MEVMVVQLQLVGLQLTIYNIYSSPRRELEASEVLSLPTRGNVLVAGDFNANHPALLSVSAVKQAGRHLAAALDELPDGVLLNSGEPTYVRGGRLDLTLVSRGMVHRTL